VKSPDEIIDAWIKGGCQHDPGIQGNRVFYTDCTASTLVHVEGRVVVEYYMLFPDIVAPLHSHPFVNRMIFLHGELIGYRASQAHPGRMGKKVFTEAESGVLSAPMAIGDMHGFETGLAGAVIYNIQIWPEDVADPRSAAIEFMGPSMGPLHDALMTRAQ
jgi:hypothetical protein